MASKKKCQEKHARRRLLQRYDLDVTKRGLLTMGEMIRGGQATFVEKQSLRVTVWDLDWEGKRVRVVYDKHRKQVVTALPAHLVQDTVQQTTLSAFELRGAGE